MTKFDTSRKVGLVTCLASSNRRDKIVCQPNILLLFNFFTKKIKKKKSFT